MAILGTGWSKFIGRRFNLERDTEYVKDKLWSYDGDFKIRQGDFVVFTKDTSAFNLKG